MDGTRGLSESERQELLTRIDRLLGDTPKGRMVRQIVEGLPGEQEEKPPPGGPEADADQSVNDPSG
jgi:hypothetical protein